MRYYNCHLTHSHKRISKLMRDKEAPEIEDKTLKELIFLRCKLVKAQYINRKRNEVERRRIQEASQVNSHVERKPPKPLVNSVDLAETS